jgi:predicted secreted protein
MTYYVNPYTGSTISPSQVGYESLTISANTTLQWPVNGNTSSVVANIIEVTATTTGLRLILPAATQVSTGQSFLINNVGNTNTFTVYKTDGTTSIISIASGISYYIYLTDNNTTNGTWATIQFGASTSVANASSLSGYGLTATGTTLNTTTTPVNYYSTQTLPNSVQSQLSTWAGGAGTLTLPTSTSAGASWYTIIKNNGTGILTIATQGSDLIDLAISSIQLQIGESLYLASNGSTGYTSWGYGQSSTFFFTQEQISVTGASATITLTSTQASYTLQNYTGALGQNTNVIVPPTVQFYVITNSTTGAYTLTFKTSVSGGSTLTIPTGTTVGMICDGTNVVGISTVTNSSNNITLQTGSATNPSLNFSGNLTTGLYLPSSNTLGIASNGAQAATIGPNGLYVVNGISGGTF